MVRIDQYSKQREASRLRHGLAAALALTVTAGGWGQLLEPSLDRVELPTPAQLQRVTVNPQLLALVQQLDSDAYAKRDAALFQLMTGPVDKLQIYAILEKEPLSIEQRHRLLEVVRHKLVNQPRGAVGISMEPLPRKDGEGLEIRVIELIAGLPAERQLQIGDRIYELDGASLVEANDLITYVQNKLPGDIVTLSIRRVARGEQGEVLLDAEERPVYETKQVKLALGSAEQLSAPNGRRMQESPVLQLRKEEAREIVGRYGPQPQSILVRPGSIGTFSTGPVTLNDELIDRHGTIKSLRNELDTAKLSDEDTQRAFRQAWERQLHWLLQEAERPDYTASDREYLRRVAERFRELMDK